MEIILAINRSKKKKEIIILLNVALAWGRLVPAVIKRL